MINLLEHYRDHCNYKGQFFENDHPDFYRGSPYVSELADDAFGYNLTSLGFRGNEFTDESEYPVVFMGCSNTFGLGLPEEAVWTYQLLEKIRNKTEKKIPHWNLAKNGSSIDAQFIFLEQFVHTLKPRAIFFLVPALFRRIVFFNQDVYATNFAHNGELCQDAKVFPKAVLDATALNVDESYALFEAHKYMTAINGLCKLYNTTLYYQFCNYLTDYEQTFFKIKSPMYDSFRKINAPWPRPVDRARDRMHHGPKSHEMFANIVWDEIRDTF